MNKSQRANQIRTNLLLKISNEILNFKKSKILINSTSAEKLYDNYNNFEITIENQYEYSTNQRIENQFNELVIHEEKIEKSYMKIFKEINKIIISEKKNKYFYKNFNLNEKVKYSEDTADTTLSGNAEKSHKIIFQNNKNSLFNKSINYLREKAKSFIFKYRKPKKKANSFYKNSQFKSLANIKRPKIKESTFLTHFKNKKEFFDETITENSEIYSSGIEGNHGISFYKNESYQSSKNLMRNSESKISFNLSNYNHEKENKEHFFEKHNIGRINPFINSKNVIKINKNKL